MALFEWTLALLLGAVVLTGFARRFGVPYRADAVRDFYRTAREVALGTDEPQAATEHDRLRLRAIAAQRRTLHRLRQDGDIGDEAFHRLEEEIDWAELDAAPAGWFQPLTTEGEARLHDGGLTAPSPDEAAT